MERHPLSHQGSLPTLHAQRSTQQHTVRHSRVNTSIPSNASTNWVAPVWSRASWPVQKLPTYTPALQGKNALKERRTHTRRSIPPTARSATVRATQRRVSSLRAFTARRELIFCKLCFIINDPPITFYNVVLPPVRLF